MIKLNLTNDRLNDELLYVIKLFYKTDEIDSLDITFDIFQESNGIDIYTKVSSNSIDKIVERQDKIIDMDFPERYLKRYAKLALFDLLQSNNPEKNLPWGSLTGIRPTKLFLRTN